MIAAEALYSDNHRSDHEVHQSALALRLERLCVLLGVEGGRLSTIAAAGLIPTVTLGEYGPDIAALEAAALEQPSPFVQNGPCPRAGFYIGLVLASADGRPAMLLSLFDARPRSAEVAQSTAAVASDVLAAALVRRQQAVIEKQQAVIADYEALEEQRRNLFDRASATAKVGVWQCDLSDNKLFWTNGVYDIFEIARTTPVTRELTLGFYKPESRIAMEAARAQAIANCTDFSLNVEIVTATGKERWVRLTGAVESRNGVAHRIFGMKQDITEEKLLGDQTRYLAEFDVMTGLANRAQFQSYLQDLGRHRIGGLLLVDLDGFKQVNDTYGHAVGDACIREAALRLKASCQSAVLVARIGGDEFAVLTASNCTAQEVEALAAEIVRTIAEPLECAGHVLNLGASVGVVQGSGWLAEDLFRNADAALYAAKAAGRNTSRTFKPAA